MPQLGILPVGMVNLLDIYPLTFDEFLEAVDFPLYQYYCSIEKGQSIEDIFHNRMMETYELYLIIGSMHECVNSWITYKDPAKISRIQHELIEVYENDFSKHNGKVNSGRILIKLSVQRTSYRKLYPAAASRTICVRATLLCKRKQ